MDLHMQVHAMSMCPCKPLLLLIATLPLIKQIVKTSLSFIDCLAGAILNPLVLTLFFSKCALYVLMGSFKQLLV